MFVMMEPREACRLAEGKIKSELTAVQCLARGQIIDLAKRLPSHAALILTPAEFEAIYGGGDAITR